MRNPSEISPRKTTLRVLVPLPEFHDPLPDSVPPGRSRAPSKASGSTSAFFLLDWTRRIVRAALAASTWFGARRSRGEVSPQLAPARRATSAWDRVTIHTDGSFHPRGRRMGWGAVICRRGCDSSGVLSILAGGSLGGDSAQAEASAIAEALESLPPHTLDVLLFSDCKNVVDAVRRAFDPDPVSRFSLRAGIDARTMERMRAAAAGRRIEFRWKPGHRGNVLNEAADILAGFGSGEPIPEHPANHAGHPRARAAALARRIHA